MILVLYDIHFINDGCYCFGMESTCGNARESKILFKFSGLGAFARTLMMISNRSMMRLLTLQLAGDKYQTSYVNYFSEVWYLKFYAGV